MAPVDTRASFERLVTCLTQPQPPRVWSLLVTVFGELAQERDVAISGVVLGRLGARAGVKPEALRVALHRLRKDGWLESQRLGRESRYVLTPLARADSAKASPRIYAPRGPVSDCWLVLVDQRPDNASGVWIAPNILLTTDPKGCPDGFQTPVTRNSEMPDWMTERLCSPKLVEASQDLFAKLTRLNDSRPTAQDLSTIEVAVLRILVVHSWRRVVLKFPLLPDDAYPDGWRFAANRRLVAEILQDLPRPSIAALETQPA